MLFLWNPAFPLPLFSKFSFSRHSPSHLQASGSQAAVREVITTRSMHPWGPAEWRVAQLRQSSAAGGQLRLARWGGWSSSPRCSRRASRDGGPAIRPDPWLSTALPSHPAAWCQTHSPACDSPRSWAAFRIIWELTPPRCRHVVYLFGHETLCECLLENRLEFSYSYEQGK